MDPVATKGQDAGIGARMQRAVLGFAETRIGDTESVLGVEAIDWIVWPRAFRTRDRHQVSRLGIEPDRLELVSEAELRFSQLDHQTPAGRTCHAGRERVQLRAQPTCRPITEVEVRFGTVVRDLAKESDHLSVAFRLRRPLAGEHRGLEGDGRRSGEHWGLEGDGRRSGEHRGLEGDGRRSGEHRGLEGDGRRSGEHRGLEGDGRRSGEHWGLEGDGRRSGEHRGLEGDGRRSGEHRGLEGDGRRSGERGNQGEGHPSRVASAVGLDWRPTAILGADGHRCLSVSI